MLGAFLIPSLLPWNPQRVCSSHSLIHSNKPQGLDACCPEGTIWANWAISGNLPGPQATKLLWPAVAYGTQEGRLLKWKQPWCRQVNLDWPHSQPPNRNSLYTKNYKRLQLVFYSLSGADDWAWCPVQMGECVTTSYNRRQSVRNYIHQIYHYPVLLAHWEYFNWKSWVI
jgi:hypothetical protein